MGEFICSNHPHPLDEQLNAPKSKSRSATVRSRVWRDIREVNVFADHPFWSPILSNDEQLLVTRLFLVFLIISLLVVLVYASLSVRTHEVPVENFSLADFEQLKARYPSTIRAPCTKVSIPYNIFLNISPELHQVCSSPFVKQKWISSLFLPNATSHNVLDFRTFAFAQYRGLALLCRTARQAIRDTRRTLLSTHIVTSNTQSRDQFDQIVAALLDNLRLNVLANEKRTVKLVSLTIAHNRVLSALRTNYYVRSIPGTRDYKTFNCAYLQRNGSTNTSSCDCRFQGNQCVYPAGAFYNWTLRDLAEAARAEPAPLFQIPGLLAGCLPLDSMRQSTLECLYNQSCIDALLLRSSNFRPKALDLSSTRFSLNATVGSMFDGALFVESWRNSSNFSAYFSACQPQSISYSYEARFDLTWIISTCVSAFGGLVIGWQLLTPALVRIWHRYKSRNRSEEREVDVFTGRSVGTPLKKVIIPHLHRTIYNFNIFSSDDAEEERVGILATRLYLIFLLIGLLILGFYTSLALRTQIRTIDDPSLEQFEELHSGHASTLACPCTDFSMSHARIMSIAPRYHQICSSQFLEDYWLSYFGRVEKEKDQVAFLALDFRILGQSFFDLMRIFCQTSKQTVHDALRVFRSTRLVTANALSRSQFNLETGARLEQFKRQTIAAFLNLIEFVRSTIQANNLVTELWSSAGPISRFDDETSTWSLRFRARNFFTNSCSCALSNRCTRPLGFFAEPDNVYSKPNITVRGLVIGCYAIDSFLLSTLECLFDRECLRLIIDSYEFDVVGLLRPLDTRAVNIAPLENSTSRFPPQTSMELIVSQLFIEDWSTSNNFTAYYTRCAPKKCTYSIRRRFDRAYMVTVMLGFYGGLSALLEIILPPLVKLARSRWVKRRRRPKKSTNSLTDSVDASGCRLEPKSLVKKIQSLNLFPSKEVIREELLATRIYLGLFAVCLFAAFLYAGPFNTDTNTIEINSPPPMTVDDLHAKNLSTLSCSCSKAAVNYSTFLSITPHFHSICSSDFVLPSHWSELLARNDSVSTELAAHYRVLASLCEQAHRTIENAQILFGARELISMETLTHLSFNKQTHSFLSGFIADLPTDFRRKLSFTIGSFGVNQLLNRFTSNWEVSFTGEDEKYIIATHPRRFSSSNCSCATSSKCFEQLAPNLFSGCFPFDGFRRSALQDLSINELSDQLFITRWDNTSNYEAYFDTCRPTHCQYTVSDRYNLIRIFTTILGLYGGLIYGLRLIVGRVLYIYRLWKYNPEQQSNLTS